MTLIGLDETIFLMVFTIALVLLILPNVNYIVKALSITLLATFLGYISNNLFALNLEYIVYSTSESNTYGVFVLIASTYGLIVSILGGLVVMVIFMNKNKKISKVITRLFKDD